jgi:glycosyltransferase involved in cell wall biosynthesis
LLPRAIASVLGQSFGDFELLIADDGSSDNTEELVRAIADPRVVFIPTERNGGDAAARNRGAAHARGEWLAFQDSDDEWLSGKLEHQVRLARSRPDANLIGGGSLRIAGAQVTLHHWPVQGNDQGGAMPVDITEWMGTGIANLQAVMIRRKTFEELGGFDTGLQVISDADFVYRLLAHAPDSLFAERQAVVLMYDTLGSLVQDRGNHRDCMARLLIRHESLLRCYPRAWARLRYHQALNEFQCGDLQASRRAALAAIVADARYWRPWAYLCLSLLGLNGVERIRTASQAMRRRFCDIGSR